MMTSYIMIANEVVPKLDLHSETAVQSTYAVARLLMKFVHWIFKTIGITPTESTFIWVYATVVLALAILVGWLIQSFVVFILRHIDTKKEEGIYATLKKHRFFVKLCDVIPALLFLILIQFTLYTHESVSSWLTL